MRKIRDSGLFGTESLMKEIKQTNVNIGLGYIARIFLNIQLKVPLMDTLAIIS